MERVIVHVKKNSEYVDVTIHWNGGFTSQHEVVRPVQFYEQLRDFDKLIERIVELRREGCTAAQIADYLNRGGFSPPKRCGVFYPELVHKLLTRRGMANERTYDGQLGPYEWWMRDLARAIPMSADKLADWARRGWIHSRKTPAQRLWILWADKQEMKRLRRLADLSHRGVVEYPSNSPRRRNGDNHPAVDPIAGRREDRRLKTMEALCLRLPESFDQVQVGRIRRQVQQRDSQLRRQRLHHGVALIAALSSTRVIGPVSPNAAIFRSSSHIVSVLTTVVLVTAISSRVTAFHAPSTLNR